MMRLATVCAVLLVVGCAATGVKVTEAQLAQLKRGVTTVEEVTAQFGQPTSRVRMNDGSTLIQYIYAEASARAASFIPIVGAFAGGTDVRASTATLRFDPSGKLSEVTSSASQYGTGIGVSAGGVETTPVPQPRQ